VKIIRVFPRRTKLTPDDENVVVNQSPSLFDNADEIHISVLFKHDISRGHELAEKWEKVAPIKLGGVAFDQPGRDFVPGMYVKKGAVITSRGCNNRCWFCSVWRREGKVHEIPITEGWNVLDDNLLACSETHIRNVFAMLERQKKLGYRIHFTGGFEAKLLKSWHVDLLHAIRPKQMFFAYDTPDDYEPLEIASRMLKDSGFTRNHMRCYVLVGFPRDTMESAESRLNRTVDLGFAPMAMLYMDDSGKRNEDWKAFQRQWARPAIIFSNRGN